MLFCLCPSSHPLNFPSSRYAFVSLSLVLSLHHRLLPSSFPRHRSLYTLIHTCRYTFTSPSSQARTAAGDYSMDTPYSALVGFRNDSTRLNSHSIDAVIINSIHHSHIVAIIIIPSSPFFSDSDPVADSEYHEAWRCVNRISKSGIAVLTQILLPFHRAFPFP